MEHKVKITVAIPTYNRAQLLKSCLESVIAQDYHDFRVVVLDNCSTDDTEAVVQSLADPRLIFMRSESNVGHFRNWTRAMQICSSPYLSILPDDDMLLPSFIGESVSALDKHPQAGFSFGLAGYVDNTGAPIGSQEAKGLKDGCVSGLDYLNRIVDGQNLVMHPSSVMMRSSALDAVGSFDNVHSKHTFDFNLYLRLAGHFDLAFIQKELVKVRIHSEQISHGNFKTVGGTGQLATMAERTDAVAYLLRSVRAQDSSYRKYLAERLLKISMRRSQLTSHFVPELNLSWEEKLAVAQHEISELIPIDENIILVDECAWGPNPLAGRKLIPFMEHNGQYWGCPADDDEGIRELVRLHQSGATFIVFGWPAFWWLDCYGRLRDYLHTRYRCVLENSRVVVFDLR